MHSATLSGMVLTAILIAALTSFSSCSSGNGKPDAGSGVKGEKEIVQAPAIDIYTATLMGDIDAIKQHIRAGTDLDVKDAYGSSPLITAAVFGRTEVAGALIKGGADLNITNNDGSPALHSAAFLCRTEIVRMLLDSGADKDIRNNFGHTALETVTGPWESAVGIYDVFSRDLGPLGLKLDYEQIRETRSVVADMLQ